MDADVIIGIILFIAGFFVFFKILNAIENKATQKKANVGAKLLYVLLIGILVIVKLGSFYAKHHKNANNNTGHTQSISEKTETSSHPAINGSDDSIYFMSGVTCVPWDCETILTECSFEETSQTSCNIQCQKLTITNSVEHSDLKEQIQCNQGIKQTNYSNIIEFSNVYYVKSSARCVNHTTKYEIKQLPQTNCPDISCRLLKQDVINRGYFEHFNFQCNPLNSPDDMFNKIIKKRDFVEFSQPKLRDYEELKHLHNKYKGKK